MAMHEIKCPTCGRRWTVTHQEAKWAEKGHYFCEDDGTRLRRDWSSVSIAPDGQVLLFDAAMRLWDKEVDKPEPPDSYGVVPGDTEVS